MEEVEEKDFSQLIAAINAAAATVAREVVEKRQKEIQKALQSEKPISTRSA